MASRVTTLASLERERANRRAQRAVRSIFSSDEDEDDEYASSSVASTPRVLVSRRNSDASLSAVSEDADASDARPPTPDSIRQSRKRTAARADLYAPVVDRDESVRARRRRIASVQRSEHNDNDQFQRPRTMGEQALRRQLAQPVTDADVDRQIEEDDYFINWLPVASPSARAVEAEFGPERPQAECFLCRKAIFSEVSLSVTALNDLAELYQESRPWMSDVELTRKLASYYNSMREKHNNTVREICERQGRPANPDDQLPECPDRTFYDHFAKHTLAIELHIPNRIRQLREVADHLYNDGLFYANQSNPGDVRIKEKSFNMWVKVLTLEKSIYAVDTRKMAFHNETLAVSARQAGAFLNPQKTMHAAGEIPSIFSKNL